MYILVNHVISRPAEFWGSAQKSLPNLPEGGVKRVINVFPNENMDVLAFYNTNHNELHEFPAQVICTFQ